MLASQLCWTRFSDQDPISSLRTFHWLKGPQEKCQKTLGPIKEEECPEEVDVQKGHRQKVTFHTCEIGEVVMEINVKLSSARLLMTIRPLANANPPLYENTRSEQNYPV